MYFTTQFTAKTSVTLKGNATRIECKMQCDHNVLGFVQKSQMPVRGVIETVLIIYNTAKSKINSSISKTGGCLFY